MPVIHLLYLSIKLIASGVYSLMTMVSVMFQITGIPREEAAMAGRIFTQVLVRTKSGCSSRIISANL
ncbi:hypothetical protein D3C87_1311750 [compost metagenome]